MKKLRLMLLSLSSLMMVTSIDAAQPPVAAEVYQQSYALYRLYHPENQDQHGAAFVQQFSKDFDGLFKTQKQADRAQFIHYEQMRLAPLLQQRREMSLKQAYVRFGVLNTNQDQKLSLKEFQASGIKTFDSMDKNQDGMVNAEDLKISATQPSGTHDGFRVKLPISMPMANTIAEFISQYGQAKNYVTLADYLTARDQQFLLMDSQAKNSVAIQEYVDEFMQRYDQNSVQGKEKMNELYAAQFQLMANGQSKINAKDIEKFAKKIDQLMK